MVAGVGQLLRNEEVPHAAQRFESATAADRAPWQTQKLSPITSQLRNRDSWQRFHPTRLLGHCSVLRITRGVRAIQLLVRAPRLVAEPWLALPVRADLAPSSEGCGC